MKAETCWRSTKVEVASPRAPPSCPPTVLLLMCPPSCIPSPAVPPSCTRPWPVQYDALPRLQLPAIGANADSRRAAPRPGAQQTTGDRLLNKRRKFQFENGHGARGAKQRRLDPGRARAHRRGGQCRAAAESARRRRRGAAPAGRFGAMRVRCRMRRGAPARRVLADGSPYRGR